MPETQRHLQAFKEGFNLLPLASIVVVSAVMVNPLPLVAGVVAEAAYLLLLPKSKWYEERLAIRYDEEVLARREKLKQQICPTLPESVLGRFSRLETTRNQIAAQTVDGHKFFRQILRKLDYLMEKFLLFASKEVQFQTYLRSVLDETDAGTTPAAETKPQPIGQIRRIIRRPDATGEVDEVWVQSTVQSIQGRYSEEIQGIDDVRNKDENMHNQAVLDKRKEVIIRRRQYVGQIGEILTNLYHQLHLMEDTFGLINDEIRARSPEQVLADIDDLVFQTDTLTKALQVVSPFDQMPLAEGAAKLYNEAGEK